MILKVRRYRQQKTYEANVISGPTLIARIEGKPPYTPEFLYTAVVESSEGNYRIYLHTAESIKVPIEKQKWSSGWDLSPKWLDILVDALVYSQLNNEPARFPFVTNIKNYT